MASKALEDLARALLVEIGEDPERDGLKQTPARFARWWREFLDGGEGEATLTTFPSEGANDMVAVTGLRVWSLCEHHLLPFYVDLTMAYIPRERLLGLSKFARLARREARRLQVQERLVRDIARALEKVTGSPDIAVIGDGEHLCMSMRGVRAPHRMHSSRTGGVFRSAGEARQELFSLVGLSRHG